jgi:cation transport protein ChaC
MTLWVFGYGSLIWDPGFAPAEQILATASGYQRSFCMRSIHHRGSEAHPGLVLALDTAANAKCEGVALRVEESQRDTVLDMLRARELVSSAYYEAMVPVSLSDGRQVEAVTYVVDRDHVQYCAGLALEEQAQIIARAVGGRGPNTEYLWNTAVLLTKLGIHDPELDWLSQRVRQLTA